MKGFLESCILVLAFAVLVSGRESRQGNGVQCKTEISDQCPEHDSGTPVYLADPENCAAYCECSDGVAWWFLCAPQTLFDASRKICDWANNVDCGSRPITL